MDTKFYTGKQKRNRRYRLRRRIRFSFEDDETLFDRNMIKAYMRMVIGSNDEYERAAITIDDVLTSIDFQGRNIVLPVHVHFELSNCKIGVHDKREGDYIRLW